MGTDHDTATFAVESIRGWWRLKANPSIPRPGAADHRRRGGQQRLARTTLEAGVAEVGG